MGDSYVVVESDGVQLCILTTSLTVYDKNTHEAYKNIMLLLNADQQQLILGKFKIKETEHDKPFDDVEFIRDNLMNIEHPEFLLVRRDLKLSELTSD
jgi:hypothetical protein